MTPDAARPVQNDKPACLRCGVALPPNARPDTRYCAAACRRADFDDRACEATVAGVRKLKSGKLSVTVHLEHDPGIEPGQRVRVG